MRVPIWNKPNDLHPWDFGNHYVAHISFDGVFYGKMMGDTLVKAMGDTGGFVQSTACPEQQLRGHRQGAELIIGKHFGWG